VHVGPGLLVPGPALSAFGNLSWPLYDTGARYDRKPAMFGIGIMALDPGFRLLRMLLSFIFSGLLIGHSNSSLC
jgi:hypothetical protein